LAPVKVVPSDTVITDPAIADISDVVISVMWSYQ
jgi:hypothetical protein